MIFQSTFSSFKHMHPTILKVKELDLCNNRSHCTIVYVITNTQKLMTCFSTGMKKNEPILSIKLDKDDG